MVTVDYRLCRLRLSGNYGEALPKWADLEGAKVEGRWKVVSMAIAHYLEVSQRRLRPTTLANYAERAEKLTRLLSWRPRLRWARYRTNHRAQ